MKKTNPLFVDTTKFSGDALFTHIELNEIPDYVGTQVSIKVTDKNGNEQFISLERTSLSQCTGKVFLTYRQEISYEFIVTRNEDPIFKSPTKTTEASYLIQEKWVPVSLKAGFEMAGETDEVSGPAYVIAPSQDEDQKAEPSIQIFEPEDTSSDDQNSLEPFVP